jgi:Na+/H+ antiporter NhaB
MDNLYQMIDRLWARIFDYSHDQGVYQGTIKLWLRNGTITREQFDILNNILKTKINE